MVGMGGDRHPLPRPLLHPAPTGLPVLSCLLQCRGLGEPVRERVRGGAQGGVLLAWCPSKTPAKPLPTAQALPAASAAAPLLVGRGNPSAPRKELGFRSGTGGIYARDQPGV